jgi:hypothetical protein
MRRQYIVDQTVRVRIYADSEVDAQEQFDEFLVVTIRDDRTGNDVPLVYRDTRVEVA